MKFIVSIMFIIFPFVSLAQDIMPQKIRYPVAAGTFYPRNASELSKKTADLIETADRRLRLPASEIPKVIIVPHNAFYFSGNIAAAGYAALRRLKPFVKRVVLIGSSHQGKYFGISLSEAKYWEMPNQRFEVDRELTDKLLKIQGIGFDSDAHEVESSLEMQLPFVSAVFGKDIKIMPILVEDASVEQVSDLFAAVWGGPETVIVISTDMSVGKDADKVRSNIYDISKLLEKAEYSKIRSRHFCSSLPVAGLLAYVRENNYSLQTIELGTSADSSFLSSDKVVGFGAFGIYETNDGAQNNKEQMESVLQANQEALLRVAAQSIVTGFERGRPLRLREARYQEELRQKAATFVNIYYNGALRGSAGSGEPTRSLLQDIAQNAYAAAFSDFRFIPLTEEEIKNAEITISVLTRPIPIRFESEEELLTKIRPNQDGLVLRERSNKALFLPQIWDTFSSPKEFLAYLKQKAGLPMDYWSPTVKIYRFDVIDLNSGDLENPESIWLPK